MRTLTLSCLLLAMAACEAPKTPAPQQAAPAPDVAPEPKAPPKASEPAKAPPEARNPYETLDYKAPPKTPRGLLTLEHAETIPWDEPVELVWNFATPLRYEVHIQSQLFTHGKVHEERDRNLLSFTPAKAATAVMTYDKRKGKEPVIVETIDMYGARLTGDKPITTDHLLPTLFPTSKTTLRPGETLTQTILAPFKVEEEMGTIRGQAHTKLLRAVRSGGEVLLELRVDFELNQLRGSKTVLAMRGSRQKGEAIVYYAPAKKRFVSGRLNTISVVNYKNADPATAGLMAELFGSEVLEQHAYFDYKLSTP